jgi:hypothetical protein
MLDEVAQRLGQKIQTVMGLDCIELPRICPIPGRGSSWQGDQDDRPHGSGCITSLCGLHPDDLVAQRVSRRRQSLRDENRLLPGLWTRYEYFRMDDAKDDAEDDAE